MPKIDFDHIDDVQEFTPIPPGKYLCRLTEIEEASTNHGDEMWRMRFQVAEGPHAGRYVFDNLVFSEAAMKRVKLICSRLGISTAGEVDLNPKMLKGKACYLTVEIESYQDQEGQDRKRNVVPFAGYAAATEEEAASEPSGTSAF